MTRLLLLMVCSDSVSLCNDGYLGALFVDQAGFEVTEIHFTSASHVLRLKAVITTCPQNGMYAC